MGYGNSVALDISAGWGEYIMSLMNVYAGWDEDTMSLMNIYADWAGNCVVY